MTIAQQVAYLKGLAEGMELGKEKKEEKILHAIIELMESIATEIAEIRDTIAELDEEIAELGDDVEMICEEILSEDIDLDDMDDLSDPVFFDVTCPKCGNEIVIDEDILAQESIDCPSCGEKLEFDFDDDEDETAE